MHARLRHGCLLFLLLLVPVFAIAQVEPAPQFAEEIEVRVVNVDVVVTDRRGNPLRGLKREDFELFEDGKPVEITYFSRIAEGRLESEPVHASVPNTTASIDEPEPKRTPVTWVVFLDQTNLPPARRHQAMRELRSFLERAVESGDRAAVASMDGLAFRIRQDLTDDRKLLLDTLGRLEKDRVIQAPISIAAAGIRKDITDVDPNDRELVYIARTIANRISLVMEEEARRTRNAIRALGGLLDSLAHVEGRLALLYVGAGFNTMPASSLAEAWHSYFADRADWHGAPRPEEHKPVIEQEIRRLFERMSATRITLYTLHGGDAGLPTADNPGLVPRAEGFRAVEGEILGDRGQLAEVALARDMAERTGGLFFKVGPGLARQLDAVRSDLSHYYSLGYAPKGVPGVLRKIKVRVKTEGARVRHRAAVQERTPEEEAADSAVAALINPARVTVAKKITSAASPEKRVDPGEANPLGVSIEAGRPQRAGSGLDHLLPFRFSVQLEALTFRRTSRSHRADLTFHFALSAPDGTVWPLESREQSLEIPAAEISTDPGQHVNYAWHVDLAPLRVPAKIPVTTDGMRLTVFVEDRATQVRSVITVPIPKRSRS